jgi:hypothetical protein
MEFEERENVWRWRSKLLFTIGGPAVMAGSRNRRGTVGRSLGVHCDLMLHASRTCAAVASGKSWRNSHSQCGSGSSFMAFPSEASSMFAEL